MEDMRAKDQRSQAELVEGGREIVRTSGRERGRDGGGDARRIWRVAEKAEGWR